MLDGKRHIDLDDDHVSGPGAVGVWTTLIDLAALHVVLDAGCAFLRGMGSMSKNLTNRSAAFLAALAE